MSLGDKIWLGHLVLTRMRIITLGTNPLFVPRANRQAADLGANGGFGHANVVGGPQTQPELWAGAGPAAEPQDSVAGDRPVAAGYLRLTAPGPARSQGRTAVRHPRQTRGLSRAHRLSRLRHQHRALSLAIAELNRPRPWPDAVTWKVPATAGPFSCSCARSGVIPTAPAGRWRWNEPRAPSP